jgi:hypothetical protein
MASNRGWIPPITAPRPSAATMPWRRLLTATPKEVACPAGRPPVIRFLTTMVKSGPGTRTRITAKTTKLR